MVDSYPPSVPDRYIGPGEPGYNPANPTEHRTNLSPEDWARFFPTIPGVTPTGGTPVTPVFHPQITGSPPATPPAARPSIPKATIPPPDPSADPPPDEPQTRADLIASIEKHRRPRAYVKVGGTDTLIPISVEVVNNNYYAADTFHIVASLTALPDKLSPQFWASTAPIQVEVFLGFIPPGGTSPDWKSVITGRVDDVEMDDEQLTLTLTGRDRTADFIEAPFEGDTYQNMTSSQVAQQLANRHGMVCDTVATSTKVGTYFHGNSAKLRNNENEWDVLTRLAEEEGFDVWCEGNILHFKPSESSSQQLYRISYVPNQGGQPHAGTLTGLRLRRSLLVAKDVVVRVKSFSAKSGKSVSVERKSAQRRGSSSKGAAGLGSGKQVYTLRIAGLTQQQAEAFADKKLKEISLHERIVEGFGPGDLKLLPRMKVRLTGTKTDFDQDYYCDAVERQMDQRQGFVMRIRLKNHSPESTT